MTTHTIKHGDWIKETGKLLVKVEPQPPEWVRCIKEKEFRGFRHFTMFQYENKEGFRRGLVPPFSTDDVLVLQEPWLKIEDFEGVRPQDHYYTKSECEKLRIFRGEIFGDAEDMPDHLNNFVVSKVIGCEERKQMIPSGTNFAYEEKTWMFQILEKE